MVHICIAKNMTSGWALTKDSLCVYVKQKIGNEIIPYKDIKSVSSGATLSISTLSKKDYSLDNYDDGAFYGQCYCLENYLEAAKNLFAE